jgi:hypothetical protein
MKPKHITAPLLSLSILFVFINSIPTKAGNLVNTASTRTQQKSQMTMPASPSQPEESFSQNNPKLQNALDHRSLTSQTGLAALWPFPRFPAAAQRRRLSTPFEKFIARVKNGQAGQVRGVYVDGAFALPVIQQPGDNPAFVSEKWGEVTQFSSAAANKVTGLLAHNYLSGEEFFELVIGQEVNIVYGDGSYASYQVTDTSRYQKLTPNSLRSDFIDLQTDRRVTTAEVFKKFYNGGHKVTFQTCLEKEGLSNWGLIFIVAKPAN